MRAIFVPMLAVLIAGPAMAQVRRIDPGRVTLRAGDNYQSRTRTDGEYGIQLSGRKECLKNKKSGRIVCLTRAEWARVAARQ